MEISLDEKTLLAGLGGILKDSILAAASAWEIKGAIESEVKRSLLENDLPGLLYKALNDELQRTAPDIVKALCEEVSPLIEIAFGNAFKASMVAMIYGLMRGKPSYMGEEENQKWKEISEKLERR